MIYERKHCRKFLVIIGKGMELDPFFLSEIKIDSKKYPLAQNKYIFYYIKYYKVKKMSIMNENPFIDGITVISLIIIGIIILYKLNIKK